jgi:hypothetical protein
MLAGLLIALPLRVHYPDSVTSVARERAVRQRDQRFVRGSYPYLGDDEASYFAMAEHPLGHGYLERRSPFCYRLLEPMLAHLLTTLGLDAPRAFFLIGVVAWLLAGLAVGSLAGFLGARPLTAAAVGALFMMTPAALDGLVYPHIIDAGSWALMFWSWDRWLRGRTALAAPLLARDISADAVVHAGAGDEEPTGAPGRGIDDGRRRRRVVGSPTAREPFAVIPGDPGDPQGASIPGV